MKPLLSSDQPSRTDIDQLGQPIRQCLCTSKSRFKAEISQLLDLVCMHFPGAFFVAVADFLQRYLLGDLLARAYSNSSHAPSVPDTGFSSVSLPTRRTSLYPCSGRLGTEVRVFLSPHLHFLLNLLFLGIYGSSRLSSLYRRKTIHCIILQVWRQGDDKGTAGFIGTPEFGG